MTFGRRLVVAVVCLPLLAVVGCADDPEPKMAPPRESPTSPSPTTTATPEPWQKKTNAGAVAFAKHWVDVFNEVMVSGKTDRLLALSSAECVICRDFARRLDRINSSGGSYEGTGWDVLASSLVKGLPAGTAQISMRIRQGAEKVRESADAKVVRNPESIATWSAALQWSNGSWALLDLELVG